MSATAALGPAFDSLAEGVCVIDAERCIAGFNRRFLEITGLPAEVVAVGTPADQVLAFQAARGESPPPGRDAPGGVRALRGRRADVVPASSRAA